MSPNNMDTSNSITFNAGLNGSITLQSALPTITKNLDIIGNGNSNQQNGTVTQIYRGANRPAFSVFTVNGSVNVNFSALDIGQGENTTGGGLRVLGSATVSLDNVIVTTCTATGGDGEGGGIYNEGNLTIESSFVAYNHATGIGGGIFNSGTLVVEFNSSILSNTTDGDGGGLLNSGTATFYSSSVHDNRADGSGAGISDTGTLTMYEGSSLSGNIAGSQGGGLEVAGANGTATLTGVTISNNSATNDTATGSAGGFRVLGATLTLTNCQITDNRADTAGTNGGEIGAGSTYSATGCTFGTNPPQDVRQ